MRHERIRPGTDGRAAKGRHWRLAALAAFAAVSGLASAGCSGSPSPPPPAVTEDPAPAYRIATGDSLHIAVWRAPELSVNVPVRPDGHISMPLVPDLEAAGKTSVELAQEIRHRLDPYLQDPVVSVIVDRFSDPVAQQVRVVGEVIRPVSLPWRSDMSVLDAVVQTGGLTQFAAGNRAVLVRKTQAGNRSYRLRLGDLLREGDVSANAPVQPGDEIIVPRSWF
jgi:polysaccharide export outer membrane protein